MAIDQLNGQGLVIGGSKVKFELLSEDDAADPKIGVQVAQKLVDAGVKAVIGPYNSGVAMPASRVYNDAQIVLVVIASNPKITTQGYPYVFRVTPTDNALGGTMGTYAAKEIALKRVAVVDDRSAYGVGGIILDQNPRGKDFSARYEKRFNLKPLMYSISFYDGVMVVAEAMKKANSVDPKKFAPAMAAVNYKGIAGTYEFDSNRDLKNSPVTVYDFKSGNPVPVKTY